MMKKVLALLLATVLCLGVLAGCNTIGGGGDNSDIQGGAANTEGPLFESLTEVEMFVEENANYNQQENFLVNLLKEQENIDLKVQVSSTYGEVLQQMISDKKIPDITWHYATTTPDEYGPDGAFVNIKKLMDEGKMPNLKKWMEKYPDILSAYTQSDGGIYAIPVIQPVSTTPYAYIYRSDVFEKHDLTFPTTKDEFYNVLKKLKELYPNSYPFVLRNMQGNMDGLWSMCTQWGTSMAQPGLTTTYLDYDYDAGDWYYGATSDNMKELLQFLNKLTEEGLMHPSCITLTSAQWTEAFANGTSFITFDKMDRIPVQLQPAGELMIEGFMLKAGAPFACTEDGVSATYAQHVPSMCYAIASGAKNLDASVRYIDWLYSDEGILTTNWGKEGVTYEVDANGNKKWVDALLAETDPQYTRGLQLGSLYGVADNESYMAYQTPEHKENLVFANSFATVKTQPTLQYTDDEKVIFKTYGEALHTYSRAEMQRFILGERKFSTWDTFQSECDALGYAALAKIHQDAYSRMYGE